MNTSPSHQRGAAALSVTLLLLFVLTLVVGFANRNLVFELRSSANQIRSTQAFEAAEAGLDWAQAMLNSDSAVDAHCEPGTAAADRPFRERFLAYDASTQRFEPRAWNNAGVSTPLQVACVRTATGWVCSCPSDNHPTLAAPPASGSHPAFALRFVAVARSGMVQVLATGCDHYAAACLPGAAAGDASARLQVTLALLPALASLPSAALTARGDIVASGAMALANADPDTGGLTAQAGGSIVVPLASLGTLAGAAPAASLAAHNAMLAGLDADRFFSRLFGLDRARWQQLPGVHSLVCPADCTADLVLAIGPDTAHPVQRIPGDLRLAGPVTLGSPERPVLLVVEGQFRASGDTTVHGAIVSLGADWDTSGTTDTQVHGALIALGHVSGNGTPTLTYDAGVLARLHGQHGTFTRVPGSWRDF